MPKSVARRCAVKVLPIELPVEQWSVAAVMLKGRTLSPVLCALSSSLESLRSRFSRNRKHYINASNSEPEKVSAYSDEAGHAFQYEAGHPFRDEAGHRSDLKPARWRSPCGSAG